MASSSDATCSCCRTRLRSPCTAWSYVAAISLSGQGRRSGPVQFDRGMLDRARHVQRVAAQSSSSATPLHLQDRLKHGDRPLKKLDVLGDLIRIGLDGFLRLAFVLQDIAEEPA